MNPNKYPHYAESSDYNVSQPYDGGSSSNLNTHISSQAYGGDWGASSSRSSRGRREPTSGRRGGRFSLKKQRENTREYHSSSRGRHPSPDYGHLRHRPTPPQDLLPQESSNTDNVNRLKSPRRSSPPHRRSPSLDNVSPPPPPEPSEAYMKSTLLPSSRLQDPSSVRKLLILDLNGSLLIRAKYKAPAAPGTPVDQRVRPVHPRPYMSTLREYLFHEDTTRWLDVMVWSSAQPHSVDSMVQECFGSMKKKLIATWARDTLGLKEHEYGNKVQTVKDLHKPWTSLANPPRTRWSPSEPISTPPPPPPSHTAASTLLLDDSPLKARLQPYNHVCLREYDQTLRTRDVELLNWEKAVATAGVAVQDALAEAQAPEVADDPVDEDSMVTNSGEATLNHGQRRKRKRQAEKAAKLAAAVPAHREYDETLLAIIGILDAIKQQSNVAGWIRAGGLWGPGGLDSASYTTSGLEDGGAEAAQEPDASGTSTKRSRIMGEDSIIPPSSQATVPPLSSPPSEPQTLPSATGSDTGANAAAKTDADAAKPLWFERETTVKSWVTQGREVCKALGIEIQHGIDR